jgi:hypothetical protein
MYATEQESNVIQGNFTPEQYAEMEAIATDTPKENIERSRKEFTITEASTRDDFREKRIGAAEYAKAIIKLESLGKPHEETFSLLELAEEWAVDVEKEVELRAKPGEEPKTKIDVKEKRLRMAAILSELEKIHKAGEGQVVDVQVTFRSYR